MTGDPQAPAEGEVEVRRDGSVWRWRAGQWDLVEPLRRGAWDVDVLNRDFAGRYVTIVNPGPAVCSGFPDRFRRGVAVFPKGWEWPIEPATVVVVDPVGRDRLFADVEAAGVEKGRVLLLDQLRGRAATLEARIQARLADDAAASAEVLHVALLAIQAEIDVATEARPSVSPARLEGWA